MPGQKSDLHLKMLKNKKRALDVYGLEWGDPEKSPNLKMIRDWYLMPHLTPDSTVLELGPGGGRWTRYMVGVKKVYVVDPFKEMLEEHARTITEGNIERIQNSGTDLPGIPENSIDFLWSYDVFVHLDIEVIKAYLKNIYPVLKDDGLAFLHYSDKTKPKGLERTGFGVNYPSRMRDALHEAGYSIIYENTTVQAHSCSVLFRKNLDETKVNTTGQIPVKPDAEYGTKA